MAYTFETKDRFVELRGSGVTITEASRQLGISYNTGVNWERDLKERIDANRSLYLEELQAKYCMSKEMRIETFGGHLLAMREELKKRDLSEIPTPKLFDMVIKCMTVLESEIGELSFLSEAEIDAKGTNES
jgi:transposase-like protein